MINVNIKPDNDTIMTLLKNNQYGEVRSFAISNDIEGLKIVHEDCQASISLFGGQVLSWQPTGEKEVFWLSYQSDYSTKTAIRGGIPICWPWFGKVENQLSHGFARTSHWQVEAINITAQKVDVIIKLSGEKFSSHWPYQYELKQLLSFGESFSQSLQITNLSNQTVDYTGALHSYFNVSGPQYISVPKLVALPYTDKLADSNQLPLLENCVGPIDRIYHGATKQMLVDKKWQRLIAIDSENAADWVLWNPGAITAQSMADIPNGGENGFVCLEAANINKRQIKPNQTITLGQTIKVLPLTDIDM